MISNKFHLACDEGPYRRSCIVSVRLDIHAGMRKLIFTRYNAVGVERKKRAGFGDTWVKRLGEKRVTWNEAKRGARSKTRRVQIGRQQKEVE